MIEITLKMYKKDVIKFRMFIKRVRDTLKLDFEELHALLTVNKQIFEQLEDEEKK